MTDGEGVLRWGVIGTGGIAHSFLEAMQETPTGRVTAVGSRSAGRAREFADAWGIPVSHGGYAELARDEGVDAVYVATPHPGHHPHTLTCLDAGKHVLVEKPMAMNALQVAEMVAGGRGGGPFPGPFPHGGDVDPLPSRLSAGP